jgi:hypothetical protein
MSERSMAATKVRASVNEDRPTGLPRRMGAGSAADAMAWVVSRWQAGVQRALRSPAVPANIGGLKGHNEFEHIETEARGY